MNVFDLFAKIGLDTSEYDKGLDEASGKASSFASKIGGGLKTAAKIGVGAIAAVGTAATAMTGAMVKGAAEVAAYGDNIDKASQKMGISAKAYQEWDAVLQHSGSSIDAMSRGLITLQKNAVDSADKFEALGLSQEQVASMSTEELFAATIAGLQNMGESAERTALASDLLGGSAKELGALLNTSAEDTQAMIDKLHEMDGVMSDESVKAAASFQDSLQDMQTAFGSIKRNLQGEFLPGITSIMNGATKIFSGFNEEGLPLISDGVSDLIKRINKKVPQVIQTAKTIIVGFGQAIRQNLPDIMKSGLELLQSLLSGVVEGFPEIASAAFELIEFFGNYLIENSGQIIDSAVSLILTLADALVDNLPTLIPVVVGIILTITEKLTDPEMIVKLVDAAMRIIVALADGLLAAVPKLVEKAPVILGRLIAGLLLALEKIDEVGQQLVEKLWQAIKDAYWKIVEVGGELVIKFIEGVAGLWEDIKNTGKKIGTMVKDGVMEFVEAAKQWGMDLIQNFIDGIVGKWNDLKKTVSNIAGTVKDYLGFSEPDKGPLSNFHTFAPDMMDLFAKGIEDNEKKVTDAVSDAFDIEPVIQASYSSNGSASYAGSNNGLVSALITALRTVAPEFATNIRIDGNRDRIVDIFVEENEKSIYSSGRGLLET